MIFASAEAESGGGCDVGEVRLPNAEPEAVCLIVAKFPSPGFRFRISGFGDCVVAACPLRKTVMKRSCGSVSVDLGAERCI